MPTLSFAQLRKTNVARCDKAFHKLNAWTFSSWAMAAAGEVGELCNKLKKKLRGEAVPKKAIADELADSVIYLDLLAANLGIDLGAAVVSKFNEVSGKKGLVAKKYYLNFE